MESVPNGIHKHDNDKKKSLFLNREDVSNRLKKYFAALRPWSFTASFIPVALGSTLAYKISDEFSIVVFFLTCLTALSVHAAGNLVNTYFDFVRGIDSQNSDDRTLVDHLLQPNDVARLGGIFYIFGCIGFFLISVISPAKMEHLALLYFGGLSSSFLYTGGLGLKYIALGDILIFFSFGPLSVIFAFLSQTGQLSLSPVLFAIQLTLNTEAILHANNSRDMDEDSKAGIVTLAILLGKTGSYFLFTLLMFVPFLLFCLMGLHFSKWMFLPAACIFLAFDQERYFRRGLLSGLPQKVAKLNFLVGVLYTLSCMLADKSAFESFLT